VTTYQTMADPTAVMGRRIAAWFVDGIIGLVLAFGVFFAMADIDTADNVANPCLDVSDIADGSNDDVDACTITARDGDEFLVIWNDGDATAIKTADANIISIVSLLYLLLVAVLWQGLTGMTFGKGLFGIRTVNQAGNAPGIGRALVRTVLWIVDALPYCTFIPLVGGIAAFSSKGHRRVGDMGGKTYVVGKEYKGAGPIAVPGVTPAPAPAPAYAAAAPTWGTTPPVSPPTTPQAAPPEAAPAPVAGEPQWDAARNAYIQWDAAQQKWLQFDDATQQWRAID
jgi:RDD family